MCVCVYVWVCVCVCVFVCVCVCLCMFVYVGVGVGVHIRIYIIEGFIGNYTQCWTNSVASFFLFPLYVARLEAFQQQSVSGLFIRLFNFSS